MSLDHLSYRAIMIDPPWSYKVWSEDTGQGRSAEAHYPTLDFEALKALPMQRLMADDCVVFMWAIWPLLPEALELGKAWGLTYKTCAFNWVKLTLKGGYHFGMGYWTRANTEPCLLFTKGKPKRKSAGVSQIIDTYTQEPLPLFAQIGNHSAKPELAYTYVQKLVEGAYLDVFARCQRPGWDAIGNEIDGRDIRDILDELKDKEYVRITKIK